MLGVKLGETPMLRMHALVSRQHAFGYAGIHHGANIPAMNLIASLLLFSCAPEAQPQTYTYDSRTPRLLRGGIAA